MLVKLYALSRMEGRILSAFGVAQGLRDVLHVTELDQAVLIHGSKAGGAFGCGRSRRAGLPRKSGRSQTAW